MTQPEAKSQIAISTRDVSKAFGAMLAVRKVSIDVAEGEVRAIIGPNGAGKTTLFNLICGNLRCTSGRVYFFGQDITEMPIHQRARLGLGRTFQQNSLFPDLSVGENLKLATMPKKISRRTFGSSQRGAEAEDILQHYGLEGIGETVVKELSYGDQRKLEIILGLALQAKVFLLDEPTAGLSPKETSEMVGLISTLKGKATIILIEHDMDVVFDVADKITVLHFGEVLMDGDKESIKAAPAVQQAYFGTLWKS